MDKEREAEFLKTAQAMAAGISVDPNASKRNELQGNLLRAAYAAATAKADLIAASRNANAMRPVASFRMAEREAQTALSTLIEWEAEVMS